MLKKDELVKNFSIRRLEGGSVQRVLDSVAVEQPLAIRIRHWFKDCEQSTDLAVTMRTPGSDRELTAGFLLTEGIVERKEQLLSIREIGFPGSNEIQAELSKDVDVESWRLARTGPVGASCGLCGKRSIDAVAAQRPKHPDSKVLFSMEQILQLPGLLDDHQPGFAQTGGLHAAALVDREIRLVSMFEDIGRHNALDKLIGSALLDHLLPLRDYVVLLSSRSSFELVQKAAMAGAAMLATVGGPSSMAIEAAREYGMTLIGFLRPDRFNVYSGEWRIHS